MKKILLIIFSIILLISGGIILATGVVRYNHNHNLSTKTYEIDDTVSNFNIDLSISDLEFKLSDDASLKVICAEKDNEYHTVGVENDTLCIKSVDARKWYEKVFSWHSLSVTIYLPAGSYNELNIDSSTGNIKVPHDFTFKNININSSTGNTEINTNIEEILKINSATGNVKLNNLSAQNINIETATGNIALTNVLVDELMKISASTGNIKFEEIDATTLEFKTSTGNIRGTILTEKVFQAESSTGKVQVPNSTNGGICMVKTSTGNISISVKN